MAKTARAKSVLTALDYLKRPDKHPAAAVCAVFGDDGYLKSQVLSALRREILGDDDGGFSLATFTGKVALLREVLDTLATVSLFAGGGRMVIVEEADPFVTQYREELESYVARPAKGGTLVLDVKTWPATTRLAKAVAESGLAIECKSLTAPQLKSWLVDRAKSVHQVRLESAAVDALIELVPPEPGILVQEVDKLAVMAGEKRAIDVQLVRENVGGWRARTTWDMIDAAADGRAAEAFAQLDRLISAGEKPHGLMPQLASTLRRFATATHLIASTEACGRGMPLSAAVEQSGVPPFKRRDAERQLKQIGRVRARQLNRWLLAADLAIKGHNSSDPAARIELERLIARLSAAARQLAGT